MRNTKSILSLVILLHHREKKTPIGTIILVCKVHYHTESYALLYTLGTGEIPHREYLVIYA